MPITRDEMLRAGEMREDVADAADERFVDVIGIDAANVVGLEDSVERHAVLHPLPKRGSGLRAGSW